MCDEELKVKEFCKNCKYFHDFICRFAPPKVVNTAYIGSEGGNVTVWPEVKEEEWCGKWKEK